VKISLKYKIAVGILNLISKTWRFEVFGNEPDKKGIVAFWHGNMLPVWYYFSKLKPFAIVSMSKDGDVLSYLLEKWNFKLVRGSSSKGSKEAMDEITAKAQKGIILITPDGPRGPKNIFKAGAVVSAQRSSSPLYLCRTEIQRKMILNKSWDKFEFPFLFSKIKLIISEPIFIDIDKKREEIDIIIFECQNKLNEQYGRNEKL
jgi:lysophospholipid acyltransferase (LPLAT)-like uncharacterized protein